MPAKAGAPFLCYNKINITILENDDMRYRRLLLVLFSFALALSAIAAEKLSTDELIQNLKAQDPKVREEAAKEVGDRGEKLGLEALDQATLDKDPKVQLAVVDALGK